MPRREALDLTPPDYAAKVGELLTLHARRRLPPPSNPTASFGVRLPAPLVRWITEVADANGVTRSTYIARLVQREMDTDHGGWPWDVADWLAVQAAALGDPGGDLDAVVIAVVRHLAKLYPNGAELLDPEPVS